MCRGVVDCGRDLKSRPFLQLLSWARRVPLDSNNLRAFSELVTESGREMRASERNNNEWSCSGDVIENPGTDKVCWLSKSLGADQGDEASRLRRGARGVADRRLPGNSSSQFGPRLHPQNSPSYGREWLGRQFITLVWNYSWHARCAVSVSPGRMFALRSRRRARAWVFSLLVLWPAFVVEECRAVRESRSRSSIETTRRGNRWLRAIRTRAVWRDEPGW